MELSIRSSRESLSVMDTAITPATHTQNTHLLCRIMVKMKCKLITFEQNPYKHTIVHEFCTMANGVILNVAQQIFYYLILFTNIYILFCTSGIVLFYLT